MIDERFIIISVLIGFYGSASYAFNTLKGKTKPNRVTWFLWALMPIIAFFAMLDKDVSVTPLITTFLSGFIPLIIFIVSFVNKKAFWKITRFDYICGALSLAGIIAWLVTSNSNAAIIFAITADVFASMPTIIKAYKFPDTEGWLNYFTGSINAAVTLLTIKVWTFANVAWVMDILIICSIIFVLVKFRIGEKFNFQNIAS